MRYVADREEKVQEEKKDASIMMEDPGESRILACELQLMGDYISNLPDEILIHILSFLSTKDAVATSVLAKRWIPLWRFVSSLDFDMTTYCADFRDATYERRREIHCRFVHSVNAVLNSRDLSQPIQRFRLKSSFYPCDATQINPWINTAMQQKIEHLDVSFVECPIVLPSCTTLVVLKLYRLNAQHLSFVQFPSLKTLCLNGVSFWDRSHLARLLSGCPVIEDLEVMQLCYYNFSDIGQDIGQFKSLLPKLVRATVNCHSIPLIAVENVEFLRINWVDETYVKERNPYSDILLQLTSQFSFCKLTCMEFFFMEYTRYWIQFVVKVLEHSPCLQNLSIQKDQEVWAYIGNDEEELIYSQSVPECFSSHLETCCIHGYLGTDAEFQFAKYVMENAILLQNMTIHYTGVSASTIKKHKKIIKLSGRPRESSVQELQLIQHQIRLQESTNAYALDTDAQKT